MRSPARLPSSLTDPLTRGFVLLGALFALAAPASLPAANKKRVPPPPPATPEVTKEFTLFMGTDFSVQLNKAFHRVRDVHGGSFVVKTGNEEVLVPLQKGLVNLKIEQSLKLTAMAASVQNLVTERAYTPETDPRAKFGRNSGAAGANGAANDADNFAETKAQDDLDYAAANGGNVTSAQFGLQNAQQRTAQNAAPADFNNAGYNANQLQLELAEENFDAVRVTFAVSSPVPLDRPYLVVVVRFHERDAKPVTSSSLIYAKAIEPIGPQPARVHLLRGGLPVGYVLEECQVRLYNQGQEIATNVAPKRVPLDRNEAFDYMLIEHLGRHKNETLEAAPALGKLTEETKAQLTLDQLKHVYYVKVSPHGRAIAAFRDESCSQPVDETVGAVIASVRFYPALEKGKATEGIARLVFYQLTI